MNNLVRKGKPQKIQCELCDEKDTSILHWHHVVERTEINTDNSYWNLAVLCPSCHAKIHSGTIRIIGIYPSNKPPLARTVICERDGKNDFGIDEPYYIPQPKSVKYHG